jgi:hypothetical protein
MSDERLERIEKRLDEIAELLRELVEMARRDWEIYQAALNSAPPSRAFEQTWRAKGRFAEAMKAAAAGSAAYVQGTNAYTDYLKERFGEAEYKPVSIGEEAPDLADVWTPGEDADAYEGMYDESGEDRLAPFYETEESEGAEVKKGEIKAKRVPQKARRSKRKSVKADQA